MIFPFIAILFIALVPGAIWLFFFLREDAHPEPRSLIIYTFGMGMLASIPIIILQFAGEWLAMRVTSQIMVSILALALIEEVFKWVAVYIAVGKHPEFDEPVDAMIYMITAALGLATIENFFVLTHTVSSSGLSGLSGVIDVTALRFVGATLLHAVSSGFVGYFWASGKLAKGIVIGTVIHGVFNYLILVFQVKHLLVVPTLFLAAVGFILFRYFEVLKRRSF